MTIQHERIAELCAHLQLTSVINHYDHLAQEAVNNQQTYIDYLEK